MADRRCRASTGATCRRAEAVDAVRQATEMRWQYMTGLYRAYVAKEEA